MFITIVSMEFSAPEIKTIHQISLYILIMNETLDNTFNSTII